MRLATKIWKKGEKTNRIKKIENGVFVNLIRELRDDVDFKNMCRMDYAGGGWGTKQVGQLCAENMSLR